MCIIIKLQKLRINYKVVFRFLKFFLIDLKYAIHHICHGYRAIFFLMFITFTLIPCIMQITYFFDFLKSRFSIRHSGINTYKYLFINGLLLIKIMAEDDALWPQPDRVGRQELEIVIGIYYLLMEMYI